MHWKVKAAIQNVVAALPSRASYATYYWLQRHCGGLRQLRPLAPLLVGMQIGERLRHQGSTPVGKVFLEVGTGRVPLLPLAFWLMGAARTITLDVHPYLKAELFAESLAWIATHAETVRSLFGPLLLPERLGALVACWEGEVSVSWARRGRFPLAPLLALYGMEYRAPADAAATRLHEHSIDVQTSYTVLEHIPPPELTAILQEGTRVLRPGGFAVHQIDYTDHFAHSDLHLSPLHFLRYSDQHWARYADNRYMYMNRLRHDDMVRLFATAGHHIVADDPHLDAHLLAQLRARAVPLAPRFWGKSPQTLATTSAWVVTAPCASGAAAGLGA